MGCWSSSFLVAIAFRISTCRGCPKQACDEFSVAAGDFVRSTAAVILLPMSPLPRRLLVPVLPALLCLLPANSSLAWGPDGHRIVNRLAAENLPASLPEFLRSKAAVEEIEYLGPEP